MGDKRNPDWAAVSRIAATQWSNVTTTQLLHQRCSKHGIRSAAAAGRLFDAGHGVWSVGKPPTTPHELAMARVLSGGPGALLGFEWALWLWDLGRLPRTEPEIVVPRSARARPGVHRVRVLERDENYGIPVTTPARTLNDCAPHLTEKQLRRAVNQAQIAHLTQRELLMEQPRLRALVHEHGATRSILEDLLFDLSRDFGVLEPQLNAVVHGVEVDFAYPGLVLEADGYAFHWTKIAFEDDRERRLHLEAKGTRVIAITKRQVTTLRDRTAAQLRDVLAQLG